MQVLSAGAGNRAREYLAKSAGLEQNDCIKPYGAILADILQGDWREVARQASGNHCKDCDASEAYCAHPGLRITEKVRPSELEGRTLFVSGMSEEHIHCGLCNTAFLRQGLHSVILRVDGEPVEFTRTDMERQT
ncbi:MAG: hypothetical protein ABIA93_02720 [Candidatus Woesearchaeota archaeon]